MLNNAPLRSLSSGYYARLRRRQLYRATRKGGRKHAKRRERYFPFHRLPHEITAEIFVLCLPDFEDVYSPTKSKNAAPPLLCNISSSWRSLALSIPRLWNELSIRIANPNPQVDIDFGVLMVESWIDRSGEHPLSLRLAASAWSEKEYTEAMVKAYLNTFFRYASRWGSVDISLIYCPAVSFPKFGPTPLLRKFSYSTSRRDLVQFPFTSCPLLSALSWPFSHSTVSNPDIPWHQLTHISMKISIDIQEALDILRTCEVLVEFNVEIDGVAQVQPPRKPVEHRTLHSFHICVHIPCSALLQSLTLPALTDFLLDTHDKNLNPVSTYFVQTQLLHLFTRSRCKLEKLQLQNCEFGDVGVLQCLAHDSCSSLTELKITSVEDRPMFTDRVILALTIKDDPLGVLLPMLSYLSLDTCVSASPGVLGAMVLKRCLWGNPLKSLTLVGVVDVMDRKFLKMAETSELDVDITTAVVF